jgi:Na+/proline symporter
VLTGCALCGGYGFAWVDLLLYRDFNGLALCQYFSFCQPLRWLVHFLLQTFMGVILGSAVVPIALAITWKKANKWGCIGGAVIGFIAGIVAWLVTTATLNDNVINVTVGRVTCCRMDDPDDEFEF